MIYLLFFLSGISGLIYQVIWVRVFGNVFGNTVYSASVVIAVFMLGLGVGSFVVGAWADRRYARQADLLRAYGYFELLIAALAIGISSLLPHLGQVAALLSSYSRDASGWYVLSSTSHLARGAVCIILLAPITLLMGGTLTLLIRHLVRRDLDIGGWQIAALYGVNTAGAALGCFLTDFALVPLWGLLRTQLIAVGLNLSAGLGAFYLAASTRSRLRTSGARQEKRSRPQALPATAESLKAAAQSQIVLLTSLALALSGFAGMGIEILWFRHFSVLLGEFRAVFSLLLTIVLIGMAVGSLAGGFVHRRTQHAAEGLILVLVLFVVFTLLGLLSTNATQLRDAVIGHPAFRGQAGRWMVESAWAQFSGELWFNARPILLEVAIPAILMGFAFPLANGVIQRLEAAVGRRAGMLYLANTVGAVSGSLAAGFLFLPVLGMQRSASVLMGAAALAVVPLYFAARGRVDEPRTVSMAVAASPLVALLALGLWTALPPDLLITRALLLPSDKSRLLTLSEGVTEVIAITDVPGEGRLLSTNGHPMSSTSPLSQRYMRALVHIPLLSIESPQTVLVMCFGVGNTAHAATLHPSVGRIDVVDVSQHVLGHAGFFAESNHNVLKDPRVAVYVNDGRHHLQIQPESSYDLITLEPPPVTQAGVGGLYSREFYALARSRLKAKGYISQWLPMSRVPQTTTLAMIRAFMDVFPEAVLVSGAYTNLLLIGVNDSHIEIDPGRVAARLANAPDVEADLQQLDLGTLREIVGTFVGSARTLEQASRDAPAVSDDRPIVEYSVRSLLDFGDPPPPAIVDVKQVAAWCPKCFLDGKAVPVVTGLDTYLAVQNLAYKPSSQLARARPVTNAAPRVIAGSAYLGAIVPESAELHNLLGTALAAGGNAEAAVAEFREAVRLEPDSAAAHRNLGSTVASPAEAIDHLRRSVEIEPTDGQTRYELATTFLENHQYEDAVDQFREAIRLMPNSVRAHNNLGVALASQGKLDQAIDHFEQALALQPEFTDAQRNLDAARTQKKEEIGGGRRR